MIKKRNAWGYHILWHMAIIPELGRQRRGAQDQPWLYSKFQARLDSETLSPWRTVNGLLRYPSQTTEQVRTTPSKVIRLDSWYLAQWPSPAGGQHLLLLVAGWHHSKHRPLLPFSSVTWNPCPSVSTALLPLCIETQASTIAIYASWPTQPWVQSSYWWGDIYSKLDFWWKHV